MGSEIEQVVEASNQMIARAMGYTDAPALASALASASACLAWYIFCGFHPHPHHFKHLYFIKLKFSSTNNEF